MENAFELVSSLKLAKKELMSQRLVPNKNDLPALQEKEIPFPIPTNWIWERLSNVSIIQEGPGIRKHQYKESGIQFLTVTNILEGSVDIDKSKKYISTEEFKEKYSHFLINNGDIVSSCSGATWGKTAIFNEKEPLILNTSTLRLRFFRDLAVNKYLYYLTKADFFKNQLRSHQTGQQPNYGYYHYSLIAVPIPPLSEQQQIVEKLDTAFDLIDRAKANIEKNIQNAKELFQSKLNQVFSEKGEGWEEKRLADVFDVRDGTHDSPKYYATGYPLITSKNLKNGTLTSDKIKFISEEDYFNINKRSKVDKGDILFAMIGTIGNPVVILDEPEFAIKNVALIKGNAINNSYFYQYYLDSKQVLDKMQKESKGATQKFVSLGYLRDFIVPNPNLDEQKNIVSLLDRLSSQTKHLQEKYQRKLTNLEELKKSILEKAFKGELV